VLTPRPPGSVAPCGTFACRPSSIVRRRGLRPLLAFARTPHSFAASLVRICKMERLRVGRSRSLGDAPFGPSLDLWSRAPRLLAASLGGLRMTKYDVSAAVGRAGTRAARLPRLRLGPRAHSRPLWSGLARGNACESAALGPSATRPSGLRSTFGLARLAYSTFCTCSRICSISTLSSSDTWEISASTDLLPSVFASRCNSCARKSRRLPTLPPAASTRLTSAT